MYTAITEHDAEDRYVNVRLPDQYNEKVVVTKVDDTSKHSQSEQSLKQLQSQNQDLKDKIAAVQAEISMLSWLVPDS